MILAPAKVNLYLHIVGKRPDGYHLLDSLVVFADVVDELLIDAAEKFSLEITGEFAELVDVYDNSVKKAAELLQKYSGGKVRGGKIILKKNLPVSAGIGGGSSDAAAALLALNDLWKLNLSYNELQKIGIEIGADVPVCLTRKSSVISGIGEEIREIKLPRLNLLLVNPGVQVSTAEVFSMAFEKISAPAAVKNFDSLDELIKFLPHTRNDMEKNAIKIAPEISEVLSAISRQNGCLLTRMSGSGATCFGIFDTAENSRAAAGAMAEQNKSWWVKSGLTFN